MFHVLLTLRRIGIYSYYPIWTPSSPRRKASNSTTTSSKAPASMASPASSTRPISVLPRRSPPSSKTAPPLSLCPPLRATLDCPALSGSPRSKPVSLAHWRRSGPPPIRPFAGPLPFAGSHPPHLSTGPQDRGGRLVRQNHSAFDLGHFAGTLHLASLLGRF